MLHRTVLQGPLSMHRYFSNAAGRHSCLTVHEQPISESFLRLSYMVVKSTTAMPYNLDCHLICLTNYTQVSIMATVRHPSVVMFMGLCLDPVCVVTFAQGVPYLMSSRRPPPMLHLLSKWTGPSA